MTLGFGAPPTLPGRVGPARPRNPRVPGGDGSCLPTHPRAVIVVDADTTARGEVQTPLPRPLACNAYTRRHAWSSGGAGSPIPRLEAVASILCGLGGDGGGTGKRVDGRRRPARESARDTPADSVMRADAELPSTVPPFVKRRPAINNQYRMSTTLPFI